MIELNQLKLAHRDKTIWLCFWGNFALAIFKIGIGLVTYSRLLLADGVQSAANSIIAMGTLIGFKLSERPADHTHAYGYSEAEHVFGGIVGFIMMIVAIAFFFISLPGLRYGIILQTHPLALLVVLISIISNLVMHNYFSYIGEQLNSRALVRNARNNRINTFTSGMVLVGILSNLMGIYLLNQIIVLAVIAILLWSGISVFRKALEGMMDKAFSSPRNGEIKQLVSSVEEVRRVESVNIRPMGDKDLIDLKVQISTNNTTSAYIIAHKIKNRILRSLGDVADVTVEFSF